MLLSAVPGKPLLPSQPIGPKPGGFLPAKRLMAAVLGVALADYQQYTHAQTVWDRRRFVAIEAWFASDEAGWPFSFVNICAALELDASAVRAEVRACRSGRPVGSTRGLFG